MNAPNPQPTLPESPDEVDGRVVVAMSGGVDSSVIAAWMHDAGYDVVGVSMRLYRTPEGDPGKSCCSPDDLYDARSVASSRGFPFYVANYQAVFRERVVQHFVDEYRRGRTPSPCVLCNDHLKFDVLLERTLALDGAMLVTGHYARVERRDDRWALLRGADANKDQSYFLFGLQRDSLARIRFPLGALTKSDVRALGEQLDVETATKPESQDICFVGGGHYADFVEARLAADEIRAGQVVRVDTGEVLAEHGGIHRFTVGQRKGLGVSAPEPLYVVGIDPESGEVRVGPRQSLDQRRFVVERCNWLRWDTPPPAFDAHTKVRYRHDGQPAHVEVDPADPTRAVVTLDTAARAIAPGQAAVFYDGDEVLGGGWILSVGEGAS